MNLDSLNIYLEIFTFIIAIIAVYYISDSLHRLGERLCKVWKLFFIAFGIFIFAEIFRISSAYFEIPNEETYKIAFRFFTTIFMALALYRFNQCVKDVNHKKNKKK